MLLHEMVDKRYADRGKWRGVDEIFRTQLPYDHKMREIGNKYLVSRITAIRWYSYWRAWRGLK